MQPPNWIELLRRARERQPALLMLSAAMVLLALICAALIPADQVTILGVSRWLKPLKFAVSISIYAFTMAVILAVSDNRRMAAGVGRVIVFTMSAEIVLLLVQAVRGVRSHFNTATPMDAAIFNAMGLLIMANTVAVAVACVSIARDRGIAPAAWKLGLTAGLLLFLIASLQGGIMIQAKAHTVGLADGGPGLPVVNWSRSGGDLRIAHFLGMHALQGLPVVGWFASRLRKRLGVALVALTALAWFAAFTAVLVQALAAIPLIPPG